LRGSSYSVTAPQYEVFQVESGSSPQLGEEKANMVDRSGGVEDAPVAASWRTDDDGFGEYLWRKSE